MGQQSILRLASSIFLLCSSPIVGFGAIESTFRSSSITLVNDPPRLLVVNPDSNSLSIVDLRQPQLTAEVAVGANPQTVSVDPSGGFAYVANRDSDTVSLVDLEAARLIRNLRVGDEPYGVVASSSGRLYVSNGGAASLDIVDPTDLRTSTVIDVPEQPRGLALDADECHLYVAHFLSGEVSIIETATLELEAVISTGPDSNLAQNILLDNESGRAYLPHTRSNTVNPALLFDTTVFPVVSVLDLATSSHAFRERIFLDIADRPVNIPLDAALSATGRLYILNAGSNDVSVIDAASGRGLANISVGDNPRGLVLSEDENALYVNNTLSGTVR